MYKYYSWVKYILLSLTNDVTNIVSEIDWGQKQGKKIADIEEDYIHGYAEIYFGYCNLIVYIKYTYNDIVLYIICARCTIHPEKLMIKSAKIEHLCKIICN